jgi:hypothetical protein
MVKRRGHILGEDFALSISLRRTGVAMAMTFIEMLTLAQQPFNLILSEAPEEEYRMIRKYLVRLTFIRAMIREAARISAEAGSKVMIKHVDNDDRGAMERVKNARLAKITTLQGTDIEQNMPNWAKEMRTMVYDALADIKNRQGELALQQEKLEEQNRATLARLDQAIAALGSGGPRGTRYSGVVFTPSGRLPDNRSTEGCAGCAAEKGE